MASGKTVPSVDVKTTRFKLGTSDFGLRADKAFDKGLSRHLNAELSFFFLASI